MTTLSAPEALAIPASHLDLLAMTSSACPQGS